MITIPLTQGEFAIVDDKDAHFYQWSWHLTKRGYARHSGFRINGRQIGTLMHHAVMGKPLNRFQIDHINGNKLDNRRENLRIVTNRENCSNKKIHKGLKERSAKYVGVSWCEPAKKWRARIILDGKAIHLGVYSSQEEASVAYQEALERFKKVALVK